MLKRYRNGIVPARHDELEQKATPIKKYVEEYLLANRLRDALTAIWGLVQLGNLYVQQTEPFKLAKDPAQAKRLDEVLYNLAETCRILAVLLWPFLPGTAEKIYAQLGLAGAPDKFAAANWGGLAAGHAIGEPAPLF